MLTPNPQSDGVRRWGLWEVMRLWGGGFMSGISALRKETPDCSLIKWGPSEKTAVCGPGIGPHQMLNLPAP